MAVLEGRRSVLDGLELPASVSELGVWDLAEGRTPAGAPRDIEIFVRQPERSLGSGGYAARPLETELNTDFVDAAGRHWLDAELLHQNRRWANADHHYGVAAECGIKAILLGLGVPIDPKTHAPMGYMVHVEKLWSKFATLLATTPQPRYAAMLGAADPFADWSVDQRYAPESEFTIDGADRHRAGADRVREFLDRVMQIPELQILLDRP